ncbi:MAG: sigma-70 family RNA polymerase sigma factor [Myxococcota bacterium]
MSVASPRAYGTAAPVRGPSLSFEAVYREHFDFTWRLLRGMGVAESAMEDVAQEVFVVVLRRLPEFDARRGSVRSWIVQVAIRNAANHRRRRRRKGAEPLPEHMVAPGPSPADHAGHRRALDEALAVMESLEEPLRVVLVLSQLEQMTAPEIATVLDLKVNTVSSRLRRARQKFAAALRQRRGA